MTEYLLGHVALLPHQSPILADKFEACHVAFGNLLATNINSCPIGHDPARCCLHGSGIFGVDWTPLLRSYSLNTERWPVVLSIEKGLGWAANFGTQNADHCEQLAGKRSRKPRSVALHVKVKRSVTSNHLGCDFSDFPASSHKTQVCNNVEAFSQKPKLALILP